MVSNWTFYNIRQQQKQQQQQCFCWKVDRLLNSSRTHFLVLLLPIHLSFASPKKCRKSSPKKRQNDRHTHGKSAGNPRKGKKNPKTSDMYWEKRRISSVHDEMNSLGFDFKTFLLPFFYNTSYTVILHSETLTAQVHDFFCIKLLKYSLLKPFLASLFSPVSFSLLGGVVEVDEVAVKEDVVEGFWRDLGRSCSWVLARPRLKTRDTKLALLLKEKLEINEL